MCRSWAAWWPVDPFVVTPRPTHRSHEPRQPTRPFRHRTSGPGPVQEPTGSGWRVIGYVAQYSRLGSSAPSRVANTASLSLLYNTLGVQPDDAPAGDRMPMDIAYRVEVPAREAITLKAPRAVPLPGPGANNPRTFGLCPKLAEARNGSGYVNQLSMLGKTGRARDRELLILRIGWNSQSEYEWSEHVGPVGGARKMGLPIERITIGPDAAGWDPFEAHLLRFVAGVIVASIIIRSS